jgi:hypothetical protein
MPATLDALVTTVCRSAMSSAIGTKSSPIPTKSDIRRRYMRPAAAMI